MSKAMEEARCRIRRDDAAATERLYKRLKEAKVLPGLSQRHIYEQMCLSSQTVVSAIELGNRAVSAVELRRFSLLYRRPMWWLLGDPEPSTDVP